MKSRSVAWLYPRIGDLMRQPIHTQVVYKLPADQNTFTLLKTIQAYAVRGEGKVSTRSWVGFEMHTGRTCKFVEVVVLKQARDKEPVGRQKTELERLREENATLRFGVKFADKLKEMGFDKRLLKEYNNQKMRIRELEEENERLQRRPHSRDGTAM